MYKFGNQSQEAVALLSFSPKENMSTLTDEQKKRIEENKARALEKLAQKRKATDQETDDPSQRRRKARWAKYYDYDLSTMEDSKGGFLVEETKSDQKLKELQENVTRIMPMIRMSFVVVIGGGGTYLLTD